MNQEVKNRVRQMALEVAGILQDLPENLTISKYELDKSYSLIDSETFRITLNGTALYVSVTRDKEKEGA